MARELTKRQHIDIKKEFDKLCSIKEFGVQKHTTEWILNTVAAKFYKSPKTIENIVFGRTYIHKKEKNQLTLL
ncbi:hypothetical protein HX049_05165 [Myroides odoratimimus]|uniref:hypothetical protein n=1 Tax=Myroides odoratimimus TaxID=76832 RepID=UPI002578BC86|nr:hypothetical protein [Myroides odoratimimus]MDM1396559.1 hypothetical protein [Myroides odoratimimus]